MPRRTSPALPALALLGGLFLLAPESAATAPAGTAGVDGITGTTGADATPTVDAHAADAATAVKPAVITIYADEFGFEAPERMPAGAVTIHLVNRGQEMHHAQLVHLKDGKTLEDLAAAEEAGNPDPDFAEWVGGPGLVAPGGEATVTLELRPGSYAWLCFIASPDGVPHMMKGMARTVAVEPGRMERLPEADNTMMLNDYEFKLGKPLHAGRNVVRVRNYAAQAHEVMVVRLAEGRTADDLLAWLGTEDGPPPGAPIGGMQALSQGRAANLELDLEPGDYALICFVPDAGDGQPHFAHGMVDQIRVE